MRDKDRINGLLEIQLQVNQRIAGEIGEILRGNPHKMKDVRDSLQYVIDERFYFLIKEDEKDAEC